VLAIEIKVTFYSKSWFCNVNVSSRSRKILSETPALI